MPQVAIVPSAISKGSGSLVDDNQFHKFLRNVGFRLTGRIWEKEFPDRLEPAMETRLAWDSKDLCASAFPVLGLFTATGAL